MPRTKPPKILIPQQIRLHFAFISCFLRLGECFDCLTERSWKIGDTRSLDDRLQASWIKTEATTNTNTTYEIIDLTIAADVQPEATANSTHAARHAEGSRADGVESNTRMQELIPTPTIIIALNQPQLCYQLDVKLQLQFRTQNLLRQALS
ncbi:hypothetical protein BJ165DRAFT_1509343 [Panaeolus papilionaceus]|nr:hypothetical protein BJ165DRAFT_1509343 [Panaeolus papilionaceus]